MIDTATLLPEIRCLITEDRLNELGPGSPNSAVRAQLQQLERDLLAKAKNRDFALACLAGLWLHHDFLDESHSISQDLHTAEGSYWHALMHRREPDYWNSKYWFRRVPRHAVFAELRNQAAALAAQADAPKEYGFLTQQTSWNPDAFVDLCEMARGKGPLDGLCRQIQRGEWDLLFRYCHDRAF